MVDTIVIQCTYIRNNCEYMYILTYVLAYRYSDVELTDGCWSPTRPAVYFVTKMNGCVDIWDIGFKQNNPALSIQVCVLCIRRVLPRPSLVVVICFAQFLKTAAVYLSSIWAN